MRLDFFLLLIEEGHNFSSFQKGVELFKTGFLKKLFFYLGWACACAIGGQQSCIVTSYHVGPRDATQILRFAGRHLYSLDHLANLHRLLRTKNFPY